MPEPDKELNLQTVLEEDLVQIHPDRLCNFLQKDNEDYSELQDAVVNSPVQAQKQLYRIPQRMKLWKKQFLEEHLAMNMNTIPLG